MKLVAEYPILPGVAWSISVLFACVLLVGLLIVVYRDLFTRTDLSRPARAGWVVLTILLPYAGAFGYLLSQGRGLVARHRHLEIARTRIDELLDAPPPRATQSSAAHRAMQAATARWLLRAGAVTRTEYDQLTRPGPGEVAVGSGTGPAPAPGPHR
ncbi:MAG TPA: hypothetical protein VMB79_14190 [Jatrophihabitans sp.]|nr:hypothetical protein [Jatrophihabitans sp.]